MIAQLAGFTLTRAIPDQALVGVITGAYKVCGGVIRNSSGQIIAHLVNGSSPLPMINPVGTTLKGINTVQLHLIGKDVAQLKESVVALQAATAQLVTLAKGTMLLSGLTLAVSAAGFVFLTKKLNKIDGKLEALEKEGRAIRQFLERHERARLNAALKTLGGINNTVDESKRIPLLVHARQTLGEINEKYRELLVNVQNLQNIQEVLVIEDYFSVTALGHMMCSAELDMRTQSYQDFSEAYQTWINTAQRIARDMILRDNPQRFLQQRYSKLVRTDEIIDWLDFTEGTDRQIEWIDDLRSMREMIILRRSGPTTQDAEETALLRRLVARNRVFLGYQSQLEYFAANDLRPSYVQAFLETLPEDNKIDECFLLVANDLAQVP